MHYTETLGFSCHYPWLWLNRYTRGLIQIVDGGVCRGRKLVDGMNEKRSGSRRSVRSMIPVRIDLTHICDDLSPSSASVFFSPSKHVFNSPFYIPPHLPHIPHTFLISSFPSFPLSFNVSRSSTRIPHGFILSRGVWRPRFQRTRPPCAFRQQPRPRIWLSAFSGLPPIRRSSKFGDRPWPERVLHASFVCECAFQAIWS
jgi:hypothetical protein